MEFQKRVKLVNPTLIDLDWATLPANLLDEILDKLVMGDYISFATVCKKWRSIALDDVNKCGRQTIPMLMLPHCDSDNKAQLFNAVEDKPLDILLTVPYSKRFIGSSLGWLISVDTDFSITLFNPLYEATSIRLPRAINSDLMRQDGNFDFEKLGDARFNHEYYFLKAVLSDDPTLHPYHYVVMLIYGETKRLAFIRPGDHKGWVYFSDPSLRGFCDIIHSSKSKSNYYRSKKHSDGYFYALQQSGSVYQINIEEGKEIRIKQFCGSLKVEHSRRQDWDVRYIVESSCSGGALLQVVRMMGRLGTIKLFQKFKVYKYNKSEEEWIGLEKLGSDVLFVGDGSSLSCFSDGNKLLSGGKIYFLTLFYEELLREAKPIQVEAVPITMGWYELGSREYMKPFHKLEYDDTTDLLFNRPALWFLPTN